MAEIVLAIAVPHSGMLGKSPDTWLEDGERDRKNPALWFRNRSWTFPELAAHRAHEHFEPLLTLEERRARGLLEGRGEAQAVAIEGDGLLDVRHNEERRDGFRRRVGHGGRYLSEPSAFIRR